MTTTATTPATTAQGADRAPVVSFRQVSKSYGAVRAVADLSLELAPGETVALLGPNGAGKSSALDLLLGLRSADSGSVTLFGTTPQRAIAQGKVGAMLQSGGLMDGVKVKELVGLARDLHPRGYPLDRILATAGITDIADRMVDKLSGGQAQRVRFALATAGANDLIVLDEPTTGMDVSARQTFWGAMRQQAQQGRTVLFATHYLEEADEIADRVIVLHRGRVLADGTAAEIKARAGARRVTFELDEPVDREALHGLPCLTALEVSSRTVRLQSHDADATVHALYGLGIYPHHLEVSGLGLEQAFIALTTASDATSAAEEAAR
ncbi:ABC transporter ATP-binding protein [Streptomyces decoyicus]|uniref:ABC transporter ATP-binding protein n=1 Tax=Streptomyces decoyicus TaxID=249567 RepID=UPI0004AB0F23|nr:ABC transporter ATP-binding protein [Streptomyces decoyicus]KOG46649.1 sulfate ABC transporter ATP-binding protein [Streptomyces decoyicus]QZY17964.1 ABC transporter ATP-binding protein [Streptomyces decoyicus]